MILIFVIQNILFYISFVFLNILYLLNVTDWKVGIIYFIMLFGSLEIIISELLWEKKHKTNYYILNIEATLKLLLIVVISGIVDVIGRKNYHITLTIECFVSFADIILISYMVIQMLKTKYRFNDVIHKLIESTDDELTNARKIIIKIFFWLWIWSAANDNFYAMNLVGFIILCIIEVVYMLKLKKEIKQAGYSERRIIIAIIFCFVFTSVTFFAGIRGIFQYYFAVIEYVIVMRMINHMINN